MAITDSALSKLVAFKKANPQSSDIEQALRSYSLEKPLKYHISQASRILGIFKANFTPLNLRVYNHFAPAEENCSEGTFREIFTRLTPEQQAIIQWGLYVPQRAQAAYHVPLSDIDLSRNDFAIVSIRAHSEAYRNKAKVSHPCLVPINFARTVIRAATQAERTCPFPNYRSEWKKITAFAKQEFNVRLVSNYTRKLFESKADQSRLRPSIAAFLMGDKTKLSATGHLPEFYNAILRPMERERLIQEFTESGLPDLLTLERLAST